MDDLDFVWGFLNDALSSFHYSQKAEWNAMVGYYVFSKTLDASLHHRALQRWITLNGGF